MPSTFYAVRGGEHHGVYTDWGSAEDHGFNTKQTARNAAKFVSEDLAINYINKPMNPEGLKKMLKDFSWIVGTSIFLFFVAILLAFIVWTIGINVESYYDCGRFINLLHPACVASSKVLLTLRVESLTFLITGTTYVCSSIVGGYAVLNGVLPKVMSSYGGK